MKVLLFLAAAVAVAAAAPQQQQQQVPYLESIEVRINNVDVIVTDHAGNRVHGLAQSDFELREEGALQPITNFSEYRGVVDVRAAAGPTQSRPAVAEPPAPPPARKFVLVFDELAMNPAVAGDLQRRADELVDGAMQPGDEMMILTPAARTKVALPFTSDKRAIRNAIGAAMRASAFRPSTALVREQWLYERDVLAAVKANNPAEARAGAQFYAGVVKRRVNQTLGYLHAVVSALAEVPGKKAVIFVTQSAPMEPGREAFDATRSSDSGRPATNVETTSGPLVGLWPTLHAVIDDVARTASNNGVIIYCLQPEIPLGPVVGDILGPSRTGRQRGVNVGGASGFQPSGALFQQLTQSTRNTFEILSETTGGKWWTGGAGIRPLFKQVADDASDYYSLGYRAVPGELNKTRAIRVTVRNHPEYDVRARRAVVQKSPTSEMRDLVMARLLTDHVIDELNVRISAGKPTRELAGSLLVPIEIRVPLSKLTFLRDGDVYRASFRVHYAAESSAMDFAPGEGREQLVEVPSADMPKIGGKFFTYTSSMRVMPGAVKFSVGVLDPLSRLTTVKTVRVDAR